jgi:diguanylate cyclase (GGDEF)-like protein
MGDKMNKDMHCLELKEELFDLLLNGQATSRQEIMARLIKKIRRYYSAKEVTFYKYDEISNQFVQVLSTSHDFVTDQEIPIINSFSSQYKTLREGKVYIESFKLHHNVFIPLHINNKMIGLLSLQFSLEGDNSAVYNQWDDIALLFSNFLEKTDERVKLFHEHRRYEQLYRVTSKFHSSMNMDDVLKEVIQTLEEVYPDFTYYLLLSHDYNHLIDLPIKEIQYNDSNLAVTQAYVAGEIQLDIIKDRTSILYAPLKGKQGVYGVLQVIAPDTQLFPQEEISFVTLLANTAGSALENAKLYQQSKRLIADLQLINETSHRLNSNLRLTEAMNYMSFQIIQSFEANEVGFILFEDDALNQVLPGSTSYFTNDISGQLVQHIYLKLKVEREAVFIGDLSLDPLNKQTEYRSLMAVPMVQGQDLRGVAIVLHTEAYTFSFETFKLLQSLIHHSTLALTNSMLREELERLVITDNLTKLHSRNYLNEKINNSMESDAYGTFLLIDIDNFKRVNDTYGHQVGDEILKQVAVIIKDNIREFDIGARWGGEELAIYLPRVELSSGIAVADRLVMRVEELTNPKVTISCGVGHWKKCESDTPITLFKRADEALYKAKKSGKNRVTIQIQHS